MSILCLRNLASLARLGLLSAVLASTGCALEGGESSADSPADPEPVGAAQEPIINGTVVSNGSLLAKSTVAVWFPQGGTSWTSCTGVIVGYKHVLTASHCLPNVNGYVEFYNGAYPTGTSIGVHDVDLPPGVNPWAGQLNDSDGKFADMALLTLDSYIPSGAVAAELPLSYPGNNVSGYMVGRGMHDGYSNSSEQLRYFVSPTYSSDVSGGHFLVNDPNVNPGDSGGPFYTYNASTGRERVHGVLFGTAFEWLYRAKYTSIAYHLSWLLDAMSYTGGFATTNDHMHNGTIYSWFIAYNWRECALACAQDSSCKAYNYLPGAMCNLMSNVGPFVSYPGATTGAVWSL